MLHFVDSYRAQQTEVIMTTLSNAEVLCLFPSTSTKLYFCIAAIVTEIRTNCQNFQLEREPDLARKQKMFYIQMVFLELQSRKQTYGKPLAKKISTSC